MLLTVHMQVDLTKRRRERTGSYPDGRGNGRLVQLVQFVVIYVWRPHWLVCARHLHHQGIRARWPIKRTQLTLRHCHARFDWSHDHLGWTIRTWRRVHWSDESRFLLRPTDGRARVWRQRSTSFQDNHILGTTAFGGGGVTVWGCFSFDCKLDLYVLDGNLTSQKYRDNVLASGVVPNFDNHALADRSMFMDDNARPHRARSVQHYLPQEAVQTIPWPAMSPDINPIEHVWDFIGRKINQRNPKCQNIDE
jgi:hypothetical protein